jgi:hypothetical protein
MGDECGGADSSLSLAQVVPVDALRLSDTVAELGVPTNL